MIVMKMLNMRVYECEISCSRESCAVPAKAYVLFDRGKAILLSDMVKPDGCRVRTATSPPVELDTDTLDVKLLKATDIGGQVYDDLNDAARQLVNTDAYAVMNPENGKIHLFTRIAPPTGDPIHKGYIETANVRKEVQRYGNSNRYRLVDTTTNAATDIDANDIKVYFQ